MDYIPKDNNYVINPHGDRMCDWIPFTEDMLKCILNEKTSDEIIKKMFPGSTFFGLFCEEGSVADINDSIDVLKATLTIHNILLRNTDVLFTSPEDFSSKSSFIKIEETAQVLIEDLMDELKKYTNFQLREGECNNSRQQHLYTLTIPLSKSYYDWLKPRAKSYRAIGEITNACRYSFLKMLYNIGFRKINDSQILKIKVYGIISLHYEWDELFEIMEKCETENYFYVEKYIGLMFLADIVSSLHLMTANVQVQAGQMRRPTSGDLLTDFWFNCYDASSDNDLRVATCEVCNGLFITNSKTQKGHERCMNRKRVTEARAKKYVLLRHKGKSEEEAAKLASINPKTAERALRKKYLSKPK